MTPPFPQQPRPGPPAALSAEVRATALLLMGSLSIVSGLAALAMVVLTMVGTT
jgi:hypothetical protein